MVYILFLSYKIVDNIGGDLMGNFFPELLVDLLVVSVVFSVVLMMIIQKFKTLSFIKKSWQVWLLNLFFSFAIGIPFGIKFYDLDLKKGIWVGLFSFVGASGIYEALKNQNIINYKPTSISDTVEVPVQNEIVRDDK